MSALVPGICAHRAEEKSTGMAGASRSRPKRPQGSPSTRPGGRGIDDAAACEGEALLAREEGQLSHLAEPVGMTSVEHRRDFVRPDQQIAVAGDSGSLVGISVYFEIRFQTKPVDPLQWLSRR